MREDLTQALRALQAVMNADFSHLSQAEQQRLTDSVKQVCVTLRQASEKGEQDNDCV